MEHYEFHYDNVVELIWSKYENNPVELKKREKAIAKDPRYASVHICMQEMYYIIVFHWVKKRLQKVCIIHVCTQKTLLKDRGQSTERHTNEFISLALRTKIIEES